jgi:hypothetical protein
VKPLDIALLFAAVGAETALVALAIYRRIYRIVPIFCIFILWAIASDLGMVVLSRYYASQPSRYFQIYMVEMSLDFLMQFAVLVELAWAVLRPIRDALPRRTILIIAALLLLVGAAMWPIAGLATIPFPNPQYHTLLRLQQAFSILRILIVFVLAGFSQLLALGWRDRELQIATGLGFYSLMSLGAAIMHTHPGPMALYHRVDEIVALSYLGSLLYWVVSFVQQEAPRQEFTPQMRSFLLAVSGAARADRLTLQEMRKSNK